MRKRSEDLKPAWENLVRVSNRAEDTVMAWLVSGAIKGLARELEDAEDELVRAERFKDALAVGRLGYSKTHTTPGEEESRVERAEKRVEQCRAELRFLLAVKDRIAEVHDARFTADLRASFAGKQAAQTTTPAKRKRRRTKDA
jgi:hypothetical protein